MLGRSLRVEIFYKALFSYFAFSKKVLTYLRSSIAKLPCFVRVSLTLDCHVT